MGQCGALFCGLQWKSTQWMSKYHQNSASYAPSVWLDALLHSLVGFLVLAAALSGGLVSQLHQRVETAGDCSIARTATQPLTHGSNVWKHPQSHHDAKCQLTHLVPKCSVLHLPNLYVHHPTQQVCSLVPCIKPIHTCEYTRK